MSKSRKDLMTIYMFRNAIATMLGALLAFVISFMNFYHCSFLLAMQRLFLYDLYTMLYFILLWLFDYIVFEMSKIVYDIYEEKVTFVPVIGIGILCVMIFFMPILDLFQYNLCFLGLLIALRMVKEMWRRTPQLFDKIKRPKDGLE